jgi:hypothetical protein
MPEALEASTKGEKKIQKEVPAMTGTGSLRHARGLGKTAVVLLFFVAVVGLGAGTALAWTDISDSDWTSAYGITASQAATVASGYQDGAFKPTAAVTRAQFTKMAVVAFSLDNTSTTDTVSFSDVSSDQYHYSWIENAVGSGLISGFSDESFRPDSVITRQQANSILGKYLAQQELTTVGHIQGTSGAHDSLDAWYAAEGAEVLAQFADSGSLSSVHAPGTAYLVYHQIVKGVSRSGALYLTPQRGA